MDPASSIQCKLTALDPVTAITIILIYCQLLAHKYVPVTLIETISDPVKSLDVIMYVPASLACSWPVETRWPVVLTCSLEESAGTTVYPEGAVGSMSEIDLGVIQ